jgi:hypothetical protein
VLGQALAGLDDPVSVQRALWSAGPRVRRDDGLGPVGLFMLARDLRSALAGRRLTVLPARASTTEVPFAFPTAETRAVLDAWRSPRCSGLG